MTKKEGVYFIADNFDGAVKTGISSDIYRRRRELQTGNPRPLKLMGFIETKNRQELYKLENEIHNKYRDKNIAMGGGTEFFSLSSGEVLATIRELHERPDLLGFLAVSEDSLKFWFAENGFEGGIWDVWEWGTLNYEDCCPYCGCLCGLIYEEKVMLYECLYCGYHSLEEHIEKTILDE